MKTGLPLSNRMPSLRNTKPHMPPVSDFKPISGDGNGLSNSTRAAGADLMSRALSDTSKMTGMGGRLDLLG